MIRLLMAFDIQLLCALLPSTVLGSNRLIIVKFVVLFQTVEFMVPMCCSKCEEKVKEELLSMEGNKLTSHDQIMQ